MTSSVRNIEQLPRISESTLETSATCNPTFSNPAAQDILFREPLNAPKTRKPFNRNKPSIASPEEYQSAIRHGNLGYQLARLTENIYACMDGFVDNLSLDLKMYQKRLSDNMLEELQNHREIMRKNNESGFWDFLKKVGLCLLGAISLVAGGLVLAGATSLATILGGSSLILSGAATVIGNSFREMGVSQNVSTAFLAVGAAFSLFGGGGFMLTHHTTTEALIKIAGAAFSVMTSGGHIAQQVVEIELANLLESRAKKEKVSEAMRNQLKDMTRCVRDTSEIINHNIIETARIAERYNQSIRQITAYSGALSSA